MDVLLAKVRLAIKLSIHVRGAYRCTVRGVSPWDPSVTPTTSPSINLFSSLLGLLILDVKISIFGFYYFYLFQLFPLSPTLFLPDIL